MILYLHGFASSGNGPKYDILTEEFADQWVLSPTLPIDPFESVKYIEKILAGTGEKNIVIGTSLGGFYALYLSAQYKIPAFIINPTLRPWETLETFLGINRRYDDSEEFDWTEDHLDRLEILWEQIQFTSIIPENLHFYLATDDEVLDHSGVADEFKDAKIIRYYDDAGHRFSRFGEIIPDIRGELG